MRVVGLCHGVQTTLDLIAGYCGIADKHAITYTCGGINHMDWFLRLEHEGRDLYPGTAREVRAARVLQEREGARRGLPPLRLLHDRVDRAPERVRALVPQEPGGARPLLRRAGVRRRERAPTTRGARPWPRSTPWSTRWSSRTPPATAAASSTARGSWRPSRPAGPSASWATSTTMATSPTSPDGCCVEVPTFADDTGIRPTAHQRTPEPMCRRLHDQCDRPVPHCRRRIERRPRAHRPRAGVGPPETRYVCPPLKQIRDMASEMLKARRK